MSVRMAGSEHHFRAPERRNPHLWGPTIVEQRSHRDDASRAPSLPSAPSASTRTWDQPSRSARMSRSSSRSRALPGPRNRSRTSALSPTFR